MAKRTYHYGQHKPLEESSGIGVVYREGPAPRGIPDPSSPPTPRKTGATSESTMLPILGRFPGIAFGGSVLLGIVAGTMLRRITR